MRSHEATKRRRIIRAITIGLGASIATTANYVNGFIPRIIAILVVGAVAVVATLMGLRWMPLHNS